ncbi:MAG: hypothetical protein M1815_004693 [Lichina confinis]|nr:MAG: hypothetical protein M1815_004693 [Lichina confinis]
MDDSHPEAQVPYEFSFIKLTEFLDPGVGPDGAANGPRTSGASDRSVENASSAELEELFSKLRFQYLEQVTKEKFLNAILDDKLVLADHDQNVALEARLAQEKARLKAHKLDVEALVARLDSKSRDLAERYEDVELQLAQERSLPFVVETLQRAVLDLREPETSDDEDAPRRLSLPSTLALIAERQEENKALDDELASLRSTLARKVQELQRLQAQLTPLETQWQASVRAADDAQRRKADLGAGADDLENRGRWWRSAGEGLEEMLQPPRTP